ncbi:MAG TPA: SusC/RagA family TonB-linked outer membrane protein, partial [Chitinophagaceae bacterium]
MKMSIALATLACVLIATPTNGQAITVSLKNAPLEKLFRAVEQQSSYRFIYSYEAIQQSKPVTIELKNESLDNVLRACFSSQPLTYSVDDKFIIVKPADGKEGAKTTTVTVRGRVISESGEPIMGATVTIKGTDKGTATDKRGEFELDHSEKIDAVIVTSIGYQGVEIPVKERSFVLAVLKINASVIEETLIRGYYTTTKRLNTGSVGKVTSAEIASQPVSNPLAALEGRVPGLLIRQANGLPGSNFTVRIRGQNSIQSGSSPLYVIDGVPFLNDADVLTQRSTINASSPFNTINPADIESIEILKDADATSIYGSRGSNGVILITTKQGKAGATKITANMYTGWGKVTGSLPFLNTGQYLEMRHEAFANDGETPDPSNAYDLLTWDTTRYTDLRKLLIGNTAHINNFELQASGGDLHTSFLLGGNYYKETTVFPGDNSDKRASVHLSLSHRSNNNKLNIQMITSFASDINDLISQDLTQYINLPPDVPELLDSTGKLNWQKNGFSFNNPLANIYRPYKVVTDRLTSNVSMDYHLFPGLNLKMSFGYNQLLSNESNRIPISSQDPSFSPSGYSFFGTNEIKSWIAEPQASYDRKLSKGVTMQAMIGTTWQANTGTETNITGFGYTNDNLLGSTAGATTVLSQISSQLYHYSAGFGRINFNVNEKYLVNITGRRDGSSRFGPGKQFANFGAIGAGWIFSKEKLIVNALRFLSFGKIRASYGVTGNDLIGNYQYLDAYGATQYPYQGASSLFPVKLFNSDYSWEKIFKTDVGLELNFFHQRAGISADWFQNKSENQIINYLLPAQTGFNYVLKNFPGIVQNQGIEVLANVTIVQKKRLSWTSSINFSASRNKLLSFPGLESTSYASRYVIGKPLNAYIGPHYAGVDPTTGVYQFYDKNHQLTFFPSFSDYEYVGTTDPDFYGGLENVIKYKDFELS